MVINYSKKVLLQKVSDKQVHSFFISNTFLSNGRLKLERNHAKAKQYPQAELLLFGNY